LDADAETVDLLIGNFPILPLKDMDGRPTPSTLALDQAVQHAHQKGIIHRNHPPRSAPPIEVED